MTKKTFITLLIAIMLIVASLTACAPTTPTVTATPQVTAKAEVTPDPTATPAPTPQRRAFKYDPYCIPQYGLDFLGDHYDDWHRVLEALYAGETEVQLESIDSTKEYERFRRAVGVFFTPENLLDDFMYIDGHGPYNFDPETKILTIKYAYDHDEYLEKLNAYIELVESIFDQHVSDVDNQFETAKELFLYTADTMSYENDHRLTVYDAITNNLGYCQTYSGMYQVLLWQAGVEVYLIGGGNHAWNVVYLDGVGYHMDTTWATDVPLFQFAMSDEKCFGIAMHDHRVQSMDSLLDGKKKLPCPDTRYDNYYQNQD